MPVLRADPWDPSHGMGFEGASTEPSAVADPTVETEDWSTPLSPTARAPEPVAFIDGVLRVEKRLVAEDADRRVPGLFGSYAAGSVVCNGTATFDEATIARAIVLGGGMQPPAVEIPVGNHTLAFRPVPEPSTDANACILRLQQIMRDEEARLAATLAARDVGIVLADGPLTFVDLTRAPVVGVVKRFVKHYLDGEHEALIGALGTGQRTPLFGIGAGAQPIQRYGWYVRLVPLRAPWHSFAGIVRCEVGAAIGVPAAIDLADRVTALLPRFAGGPADPRAPQNLAPIGALESNLRRAMGDRRLIGRALDGWLISGGTSWTT